MLPMTVEMIYQLGFHTFREHALLPFLLFLRPKQKTKNDRPVVHDLQNVFHIRHTSHHGKCWIVSRP